MTGRRAVVAWFGLWTALGLLSFLYAYLDLFARGQSEPFHIRFIEELTGNYAAGILSLGVIRLARGLVGRRRPWYVVVGTHAAAMPVYSVLHTSLLWVSRKVVFAALGLGVYDYGVMSYRYVMEFPNDVMGYAVIAVLVHLFLSYRASEERALRAARLEAELQQARLAMLEGQLRPHFLFNALNTISSVMYRDLAAADRMIRELGELLRSSLHAGDAHEVPLAREVETLELYLSIMRARFGERLEVAVDVGPPVVAAAVPAMLLQPLVENALAHGDPGPGEAMRVTVTAARRDDTLVLRVADNGPGGEPAKGNGIGLRNTAQRLDHLYGKAGRLRCGNPNGMGFEVVIELPFRCVGDARQ